MAEKKILIFTCDRCGNEKNKLRGSKLPAGWEHVRTHDLCPDCVSALDRFLMGTRLDADQIIREAVNAAQEGVVTPEQAEANLGIERDSLGVDPNPTIKRLDFGAPRFA